VITIATVTVRDAETSRVLSTVEEFFDSSNKFFASRQLEEPQWGLVTSVRGYVATGGGETLAVRVISDGESSVGLEIEGNSYPLFDWGSTKRRVLSVVQCLRDRDMSVEVNSIEKHHKVVGPIRIVGG
jgi:hypothetical protein